jgi:hypothetical protein
VSCLVYYRLVQKGMYRNRADEDRNKNCMISKNRDNLQDVGLLDCLQNGKYKENVLPHR